jgi:hypothetical protein
MHKLHAAAPQPTATIAAAVAGASRATGERFDFLLANARLESGLNANAKARTSSATGLFQFVERTWLAVVKRHGAKHGLGWAAAAIDWAGGSLSVANPLQRDAILKLREDAGAAAAMAAEHTADNRQRLVSRLGRPVNDAELYIAHFLGAGGATRFLKAMGTAPDAAAASVTPRAARANHGVFYDRGGRARSLSEVFDHFAARLARAGVDYGNAPPRPTTPARPRPTWTHQDHANAPDLLVPLIAARHAQTAYLILARLGA